MKSKYLFLASVIVSATFASCEKEDAIVPNVKDTSFYFAPNDTCTDEESVMRRDFFQKHGSYLLFNDTIQHEFVGIDINGDSAYFTEKLEITYSIGDVNTNNKSTSYTLITNLTRKKEAVEFIEENILYHFTNDLQPFSWFLANQITLKDANTTTKPVALVGQRAIALSMYNLPRLRTEDQKKNYIDQILVAVIDHIVKNRIDLFTKFFEISSSLYSMSFEGYEEATADECLAYLNTKGFIARGKNGFGAAINTSYPDRSADLGDYARLVAINTIDQIETKYTNCPIVIQKAKLMRESLMSVGYKFEKEEK